MKYRIYRQASPNAIQGGRFDDKRIVLEECVEKQFDTLEAALEHLKSLKGEIQYSMETYTILPTFYLPH